MNTMKPFISIPLTGAAAIIVSWIQTAIINQWFTFMPLVHVPLALLTIPTLLQRSKTYLIWAVSIGLWAELSSFQSAGVGLACSLAIALLLQLFFRAAWNSPSLPAIVSLSALASLLFAGSVLAQLLATAPFSFRDIPIIMGSLILHIAIMTTVTSILCVGIKRLLKVYAPRV